MRRIKSGYSADRESLMAEKRLERLTGVPFEIRKSFVGKRPRTSARLTRAGRAAFELHVAALQEIVIRSGASILPR